MRINKNFISSAEILFFHFKRNWRQWFQKLGMFDTWFIIVGLLRNFGTAL